jgi:hypothetical protein
LFKFVSPAHGANEVLRVVIRNELKGICNALNQIVLFNICHDFLLNLSGLTYFKGLP